MQQFCKQHLEIFFGHVFKLGCNSLHKESNICACLQLILTVVFTIVKHFGLHFI